MTPKERAITAFEHREPDRTPLFERLIKPPTDEAVLGRPCALGFIRSMEIHEEEGWRALMDRQARDTVDLAKALGFDMIALRGNIPEDAPQPWRVGEYLWQVGDSFSQFLPESDIVRTVPAGVVQEETEELRMQRTVEEIEAEYEPPPLGDDRFYVDLDIEVDEDLTLGEAHRIVSDFEAHARAQMPEIAQINSRIEPRPAAMSDSTDVTEQSQRVVRTVREVVATIPGIAACHSIAVRRQEDRLFVSVHCVCTPAMPVGQAHRVASRVEGELHAALPDQERALVHTEPPRFS